MNRQEPYIGMPIVLGDFDDDQMTCCGNMEIQPRESGTAEGMRRPQEEDGQRMEERQRTDDRREQTQHMQNMQDMQNMQSANMTNQSMQTRQPMVLAMAYVPWQRWNEVYAYDEGLDKGTIFPDLNLPFEGRRTGGNRR